MTLIIWHCKEGRKEGVEESQMDEFCDKSVEFTWDVITDRWFIRMKHMCGWWSEQSRAALRMIGFVWMTVQWRCCRSWISRAMKWCGDFFHLSSLLSDNSYYGLCTFCFIFIIILFLNALLICQRVFDAWADICYLQCNASLSG